MKRRWLRFLLLFLVLISSGSAGPALNPNVELNFKVDPPNAEIILEGMAGDVQRDRPQPLGTADKPIVLERAKYPTGTFTVVFRADGYEDLRHTFALTNTFLNSNKPVDVLVDGREIVMVRKSRFRALLAGVLMALAAAVGAGFAYKASRGKTRDMAKWVVDNAVPADDGDPLIGKRLEAYWILEKLGRGGMATVYRAVRAEEGSADQVVAIKVIHPHIADNPDFLPRFRREVGISSELIHPNIITVYNAGIAENRHYIALEIMPGSDLRSKLPEGGFSLPDALAYLIPIFEAVAYAHGKGVVHRDLKPENILVSDEGGIKLSDFGLARSHNFSTVTATGNILGTPAYMAPEQIQGISNNPASDQYALGMMTFELCTGKLPFEADDAMAIIMKHLSGVPDLASVVKPSLPSELDAVISRMLLKDPAQRYPSVADALFALRKLL